MVIERAVMALVLVFMVDSLLGLGLQLALGQAITALPNRASRRRSFRS